MEKKGYKFAGWYVDPERKKRVNPGGILPRVTTLYDKWVPIWYPILYQLNGGVNSRKNPRFVSAESREVVLEPARKKDMRFKEWTMDGKPVTSVPGGLTEPVMLVAHFVSTPIVSFESNGGGRLNSIAAFPDGTLPPILIPMRIGYSFQGWYWDPRFLFPYDQSQIIHESCTLYAKWELLTYTITYNTDGGYHARSNPSTYTFEDSTIIFKPAYKKGYEFIGWYNERGRKIEFIRKKSVGDRVLTARFKKKEINES